MDEARIGRPRSLPDRWWAVSVSGDLDLTSGPGFESRMARAVAHHPADGFVLDLSRVTFMDCGGLRPVLLCRNQLGARLCLRAVPDRVLRLLVLADVAETLRILPGAQSWPVEADPGRCGILLDDSLGHRPARTLASAPVQVFFEGVIGFDAAN